MINGCFKFKEYMMFNKFIICVKFGVILVVIYMIKMVVVSYIIIIVQSMCKVVEFGGCCGYVGGVFVVGNMVIICCY